MRLFSQLVSQLDRSEAPHPDTGASWRRLNQKAAILLCLGAFFASLASLGCVDLRLPVPESSYRARVSVTRSTNTPEASSTDIMTVDEIYASGKLRREIESVEDPRVFIDRPDLRVRWVLNPDEKSFDEYRIFESGATPPWILNPFGSGVRADFKPVGTEEIDGSLTRKYAVSGKQIEGLAWFTEAGIPLRFRGTLRLDDRSEDLAIDYSNIMPGSQPAWLFAVPPNFAGYEDRMKPPEANKKSADPEAVRRVLDGLKADQVQGSGPR